MLSHSSTCQSSLALSVCFICLKAFGYNSTKCLYQYFISEYIAMTSFFIKAAAIKHKWVLGGVLIFHYHNAKLWNTNVVTMAVRPGSVESLRISLDIYNLIQRMWLELRTSFAWCCPCNVSTRMAAVCCICTPTHFAHTSYTHDGRVGEMMGSTVNWSFHKGPCKDKVKEKD